MNRITFHTMIGGLLAIVCAGLFSCSDEDGFSGIRPIYVSFRVTASGVPIGIAPPESSGSWGDDYAESQGTEFENRIDSLHVAFYDSTDKSYAGRLEYILHNGSGFYGELHLEDPEITTEELRKKHLKMMVMANMPDVTEEKMKAGLTSESDGLGSLTYEYIGQKEGDFPSIPMWGVCSPDLSDITPGKVLNVGNVDLLRAMAKVEVCVDKDNEELSELDVKVESVTVSKVNKSGYGLPGKWNEKSNTADLTFGETLRVPSNVQTESNKKFNADESGTAVFYLSECKNETSDMITMTVSYTVGDEKKEEGTIYFCPYKDGKPDKNTPWDIVRNHHYRYEISGLGKIKFSVDVHPWGEESHDIPGDDGKWEVSKDE